MIHVNTLLLSIADKKKLRLFGFIFGNIEKHKTLSFTPYRIKAYNVVHARTHT